MLVPVLFSITLLPLAWKLGTIHNAQCIMYADDITLCLWSVHPEICRQEQTLQEVLKVTYNKCAPIGLEVSKGKTRYMPAANKYGRRLLALRPLHIYLDHQPLHEAPTMRMLGIETDAS